MSSSKAAGVAVCIIVSLLAILAVCLRLYVRRRKRTSLGVDDYTILASLVCLIFNSIPNSFVTELVPTFGSSFPLVSR